MGGGQRPRASFAGKDREKGTHTDIVRKIWGSNTQRTNRGYSLCGFSSKTKKAFKRGSEFASNFWGVCPWGVPSQRYPQCWEFHDNGSERPSPEPLPKKEASPAVLGTPAFWKCSGSLKCLALEGLGDPSRTLEGNSRKRSESVSGFFPEVFRNFFRKVPAVLGV